MSGIDAFSTPESFAKQLQLQSPQLQRLHQTKTEPGALEGSLSALWMGPRHALDIMAAGLAGTVDTAVSGIEGLADSEFADWLHESAEQQRATMRASRADPKTMGMVAQGIHGITSILPIAVVGAVAAAPVAGFAAGATGLASAATIAGTAGAAGAVGTSTGFDKYDELREQGVDHDTALKAASVTGGVMGIGTALMPYYGQKLAAQLTSGVGINVGLGAVERGGIGTILENEGYGNIAQHYKALDGMQMGIDAILGLGFVFGGRYINGRRVRQESIDDAMAGQMGLHERTGKAELGTTILAADHELARANEFDNRVLSGENPGDIPVAAPHKDTIPNPKLAEEAIIGTEGVKAHIEGESGRPMSEVMDDIRKANEVAEEHDAVQIGGTEEVDVRQQARDGEALAKGNAAEEVAGTRQKEEGQVKALEETKVMYDTGNGERPMTAKQVIDHIDTMTQRLSEFIKCVGG